MNNFITYLLNLKDAHKLNPEIIPSPPSELVIRLEYPPEAKFCPVCGFRMHSKGVYIRTVNHQILQDGRKLVLKLHQHKWKCQNTDSSPDTSCTDELLFAVYMKSAISLHFVWHCCCNIRSA